MAVAAQQRMVPEHLYLEVQRDRDRWKSHALSVQRQLSNLTTLLGCSKFTEGQRIRLWGVTQATGVASKSAGTDGWGHLNLHDVVTVAGIRVAPRDDSEEARRQALENASSSASKAVTLAEELGIVERGEPTYYHDDPEDPRRITGCSMPIRLTAPSAEEALRQAMMRAPERPAQETRGKHSSKPKCPVCQSERLHCKCADCGFSGPLDEFTAGPVDDPDEDESSGLQNLQTENGEDTVVDNECSPQILQAEVEEPPSPPESPPGTLPVNEDQIPAALKERPLWVAWRWEWDAERGKWTKVPINARTLGRACVNKPSTWTSFEEALAAYYESRGTLAGIGYVFSRDDPYTGVDYDKCRDLESGTVTEKAQHLIFALSSYAELSATAEGIHVLVEADKPSDRCSATLDGRKIEMYSQLRWFAVTGWRVPDTPATIEPRQAELAAVYEQLFPSPIEIPKPRPLPTASGGDIIARARHAANGAKFERLWAGDWAGYPSQNEADQALCRILAYWTQDPEHVDRLFRQSELYRPKWDARHYSDGRTYGEGTIQRALSDG